VQLSKLSAVASTLGQVNAHIDAVASTGTIQTSTQAVSALADIIRAQGTARGDLIETKLLDYAAGHDANGTPVASWVPINEATLTQTIHDTPVGLIVPARVSVESVVPASTVQYEGNDGAHTPFTITLTRAGNIESVVSLDYTVNPGSGMVASNFVGGQIPHGTVTFAAGQATVDVTVMVLGDNIKALDENFGVVISDPLGQTQLFDANGQQVSFLARNFTVLNDDPFTPQITAPTAIDLGTGLSPVTLNGFSLDYYKPGQTLTVKVSTVAGATFDDSAITTPHVIASQQVNGNTLNVMTLTGNVADINNALSHLKVSVDNAATNAFFVVEATDGTGVVNKTEIPVTLHHPAQLTSAALPDHIVAGALTTLSGFSVSDVDGGVLTVTLDPSNMSLQVPATLGVSTTVLDSGGLTLVGKAVDINNALSSLAFTAASDGSVGLTASVTDADPYSFKQTPVVLHATADPAPTLIEGPAHLVGSVGTPTSVSGLFVSDLDSKTVSVDVVANGGSLSLSALNGVDVRQISAGHYTVAGNLADVNKTLQNLTFTGAQAGQAGSITVSAFDPAQASVSASTQTISVDVLSRAAPQAGGDVNYHSVAGFTPVVEDTLTVLNGLTVNNLHADAGQIPTQVRVLSVTGGTLYDLNGNAIALGSAGTLVNLINGNHLGLQIQPDLNRNDDIKITYAVVDTVNTSLNSAPSTFTLPIKAVNDAPVQSTDTVSFSYTEDAAAVKILTGLKIADVDSVNLQSATVSITNHHDGDVLSVSTALPSGVTYSFDQTSGTLTFSGSASVSAYQNLLNSVVYKSDSQNPSTELRNISVLVNDGTDASTPVTLSVSVVSVNDAPNLIDPVGLNVLEQTSLALNGKGLQVTDVDVGNAQMTLTLKVAAGALNVSNHLNDSGLSADFGIKVVSGNGSTVLTLQGTKDQINNFLANSDGSKTSLAYLNPSDTPSASDQLTVTVSDNGAAGAGGALTATRYDPINITAVNDAPALVLGMGTVNTDAMYATAQGSVVLAASAALADVDSAAFSALQVKITDVKAGDVLSLSAAAKQTLLSDGVGYSYDASKGVLSLITQGQPISQADLQSIIRGVTFSTSYKITDPAAPHAPLFTPQPM